VEFSEIFQQISQWMENFAYQYGYFGIFLISLLGASSIIFPIPYTVIIFALGNTFEPLWIAVAAGLGAAIGEILGYLIGVGGGKFISEKYQGKMESVTKVIERYGWIYIFVFALTPLPDDLLFIPLGVMRYGLLRAFVPALIGKFLMSVIVAYSGRFSVQVIKEVFGIESSWISLTIGIILGLALLISIIILRSKIDVEAHLEKYVKKENMEAQESGKTE
jgi:membrane protein YqaA with SNARE-associated domain